MRKFNLGTGSSLISAGKLRPPQLTEGIVAEKVEVDVRESLAGLGHPTGDTEDGVVGLWPVDRLLAAKVTLSSTQDRTIQSCQVDAAAVETFLTADIDVAAALDNRH